MLLKHTLGRTEVRERLAAQCRRCKAEGAVCGAALRPEEACDAAVCSAALEEARSAALERPAGLAAFERPAARSAALRKGGMAASLEVARRRG